MPSRTTRGNRMGKVASDEADEEFWWVTCCTAACAWCRQAGATRGRRCGPTHTRARLPAPVMPGHPVADTTCLSCRNQDALRDEENDEVYLTESEPEDAVDADFDESVSGRGNGFSQLH